ITQLFKCNWLIHNVLVSDFEGSNPSFTAKSKKTDLRVGFLLSGKHLCRQVSQSHAVADHPRTHPPVCKALMEHQSFSYCQLPPPTLFL
ncbi:hypothetical protein, partial [Aeromonas veronii]|uniref:hypothetical protein n=1 Tax=Aeromonas veronii TaxID=654 RepID=UPI003B9F5250